MPIYMCRWENGDISFVSATSKDDAIWALDEVGMSRANRFILWRPTMRLLLP